MFSEPIYQHDGAYAREHNELDQYRASMRINVACKEAIEGAIRSHFDGFRLGKAAVTEVMDDFGEERVQLVLANTIQQKLYDGRFAHSNKEWAMAQNVCGMDKEHYADNDCRFKFCVASHPAVLDGYTTVFRQEVKAREEQRKPSVLDKVRAIKAKQTAYEKSFDDLGMER